MTENPQEIDRESWLADRVGKVTASKVHAVVRRKRDGKPYADYDTYLWALVTERLTGRRVEVPTTWAMQRGVELEPLAAAEYEMQTDQPVTFSGFVDHVMLPRTGCSPDRLVGSDGVLEIKCPLDKDYLEFFMSGSVPEQYYWQALLQMSCTGRHWVDIMYYHPDMPDDMQMRIVRLERSKCEADIEIMMRRIEEFDREVCTAVTRCQHVGRELIGGRCEQQ